MTEELERSEFEPRLPEDPAYWSALADRITRTAAPVFAGLEQRPVWWRPFDRLAPALGIGAVAAAVATFVVLPAAPSDPAPTTTAQTSPTDLAGSVFTAEAPPDMMSLMITGTEEQP